MCMLLWEKKNRFGIFTKCFNKWKAFKKVHAKMAAKKIFFFKCEKSASLNILICPHSQA